MREVYTPSSELIIANLSTITPIIGCARGKTPLDWRALKDGSSAEEGDVIAGSEITGARPPYKEEP